MRTFKTKWFQKWATKEGLTDAALLIAVEEMDAGLVDAKLGGHVIKKRVALPGRGNKAFFVYGFAKNKRANIDDKQLKVLKLFATELLSYTEPALRKATKAGELIEVQEDG